MLPLYDVALDDVKRRWRRAKNCHPIVQNLTHNIIKYVFKGYKLSEIAQNIYSYSI